MNELIYIILVLAALGFLYRLCAGPTLADRVLAMNGLLLVGMGALAARAADSGNGTFLPMLIIMALVGPISSGITARFIERQAE